MSGPVSTTDAPPSPAAEPPEQPDIEVIEDRTAQVGGIVVRRALPKRARRTVGPWCFLDHFGPASAPMEIGPHPHTGLATVTWVVQGEVLHRDGLGTEQLVRPGQLNLMSAGRGVAHAEESPGGDEGTLHGAQLWVAQPERTRTAEAAFEHHPELPVAEPGGGARATVLVGELGGARSPARTDHPAVGADVVLGGGPATVPLDPAFEHALVVLSGVASVDGRPVEPGWLADLGRGRAEIGLAGEAGTPVLLVGGAPFEFPPVMWWNFVGRTREEVAAARADWMGGSDRFGPVPTSLGRIPAPELPWTSGMDGPRS